MSVRILVPLYMFFAWRANFLALLPEICLTQACRRLVLRLVALAGKDQYHDRYHVRKHLAKLLGRSGQSRHINVENIECAKDKGAPDRI